MTKVGIVSMKCLNCGEKNPVKMGMSHYSKLPAPGFTDPKCPSCGASYFPKSKTENKLVGKK